jgi:hypothetical protein
MLSWVLRSTVYPGVTKLVYERLIAFGVLWMWGSAGLLLDQNAEGRFYRLYMLAVALVVDVYLRLAARPTPTRLLLLHSLLAQAALLLTHVLGLFYSGIVLLALVLFDALDDRFRIKVYLFHAAGCRRLRRAGFCHR